MTKEFDVSSTVETGTEFRPFEVDIPQEELDDLRRRIVATRWPERETVADDSQGVPLALMQELTNTGVSAARLYWENQGAFFDAKDISIPYAISVFPDELYEAPRSWAERACPDNLIHYNRLDRGGHFAAWEQPQLFCQEMRAAFRTLR